MTRLKNCRLLVASTLAIALTSSIASVLEADTLSIGGTFHVDQLTGTVGADLTEVFANGNEHTWSLTLQGVTYSHDYYYYEWTDQSGFNRDEQYITLVHATSFDFQFFGPDADVLNEVVSQQLIGGGLVDGAFLELMNGDYYEDADPWGSGTYASWYLGLQSLDPVPGVSISAGNERLLPFSTDENGYPIVGPQRVLSTETLIWDNRPGNSGVLASADDFVDIEAPILSLPGDYNGNGIIDAADYATWRDALTAGSTLLANDPTPGTVDESDFFYWQTHFGQSLGNGAGAGQAAVPEPSSLALLSIGLPLLVWRNWQRSGTGRMRGGRRFVLTTATRALAGNDVSQFFTQAE